MINYNSVAEVIVRYTLKNEAIKVGPWVLIGPISGAQPLASIGQLKRHVRAGGKKKEMHLV